MKRRRLRQRQVAARPYTFGGHTFGTIDWSSGTGTLPTSITIEPFLNTPAPSLPSGSNALNFYTHAEATGGSPGYTYTMTLSYEFAGFSNAAASNLKLLKSPTSPISWAEYPTTVNTTNKTFTATGLTSFSYFTGGQLTVVPVELMTFTGKNTERGNILAWTTASEVNNKGFDIERQSGNSNWAKLG